MACGCAPEDDGLARRQGRLLRIVLGLNLGMFVVEGLSGYLGKSSALQGDSLDMLGDALAYGATLLALDRAAVWKARAARLKAVLMGVTALGVLAAAIARAVAGALPSPVTMGGIGVLALVVNATCLALLMRHRDDDVNMSTAWTCSRNDILANVSVLGAGAAVAATGSLWPDFAVGVGIAALFMASAFAAWRATRTIAGPLPSVTGSCAGSRPRFE
jgi:Co/Zn/Cd efflux system component